ncbi:MAG: DUF4168 domain-containing protein [Solirubrobacterales bacterium]
MKLPLLSAALVSLSLAVAVPAVRAADAPDVQPPPAAGQALEPSPDDGELANFVAAFVRLIGVQHGYMMMIQQESDPSRVDELTKLAVADMEAAVKQDGMSIDRYNQIALAVREDPGLQDRVQGILEQLASDPSADQDSEAQGIE